MQEENNNSYNDQEDDLVKQGIILYKQNELITAEYLLKKAIKLGSKNQMAFYVLALIKKKHNNVIAAFRFFEFAFDLGFDKAIFEILKLLYIRTGECEFLHCSNSCCKNLILNGPNGKPISSQRALDLLINEDAKHTCWYKTSVQKNGDWLFGCTHNAADNSCTNYKNRPDICRDYPSHPLVLRKGCTYNFVLQKNMHFSSPSCFSVVCELLLGYGFTDDVMFLKKLHTGA